MLICHAFTQFFKRKFDLFHANLIHDIKSRPNNLDKIVHIAFFKKQISEVR